MIKQQPRERYCQPMKLTILPQNFQINIYWKSESKQIQIYKTLYISGPEPHQTQQHSFFCIPFPPSELGEKNSQEKERNILIDGSVKSLFELCLLNTGQLNTIQRKTTAATSVLQDVIQGRLEIEAYDEQNLSTFYASSINIYKLSKCKPAPNFVFLLNKSLELIDEQRTDELHLFSLNENRNLDQLSWTSQLKHFWPKS